MSVCLSVSLSPTQTCRSLADWCARAAAPIDTRPQPRRDTSTMGCQFSSTYVKLPWNLRCWRALTRDVDKRTTLVLLHIMANFLFGSEWWTKLNVLLSYSYRSSNRRYSSIQPLGLSFSRHQPTASLRKTVRSQPD